MNLTIVDPRNISVCVIAPSDGTAYNWSTGMFGAFSAASNLKSLGSVSGLPAAFANLKTVYVDWVLLNRSDTVPVFVSTDSSGNIIQVTDVWNNPSPMGFPLAGGFVK